MTTQMCTKVTKFIARILIEVFDMMKAKTAPLSQSERVCCLTLDEFSMRPSIDYESQADRYTGHMNLPGHDMTQAATRCLVFQIGSLMSRFKLIVAYYFTGDSADGTAFGPIIQELVHKADSCSLHCINVTR